MKRCVIRANRSVTGTLRCQESWERHRIWFWGVGCPVVADDIGGRQSELTWWPQRNIQRKNIWCRGMTDLSIHHGAKRERDSQNEWHLHYILSYSLKVLVCMCTRACVSLMKFLRSFASNFTLTLSSFFYWWFCILQLFLVMHMLCYSCNRKPFNWDYTKKKGITCFSHSRNQEM